MHFAQDHDCLGARLELGLLAFSALVLLIDFDLLVLPLLLVVLDVETGLPLSLKMVIRCLVAA